MPAPAELIALMQRYNQLGRLLPQVKEETEAAMANAEKRAEMRLITAEMHKVKAEIDAFLDKHGVRP